MVNEHNLWHSISWDIQLEKCKKQKYTMWKTSTFEDTQLTKLNGWKKRGPSCHGTNARFWIVEYMFLFHNKTWIQTLITQALWITSLKVHVNYSDELQLITNKHWQQGNACDTLSSINRKTWNLQIFNDLK
jgi:hypothetical protein